MLTNRSPPKTTNMAPLGGLFGSQLRPDDNVGVSDINAANTPSKYAQFGQHTNQIHPLPGYCYLSSQPPFPGALQFYHHALFNMTPSFQPSTVATQGYQSYGPPWQAYDFPQGGYGGPQMYPPQQITRLGLSSPGAPRVPPALPQNIAVIRPNSSSFTAPGQGSSAPGRPLSSLPMK
jgi:hypothetical protein